MNVFPQVVSVTASKMTECNLYHQNSCRKYLTVNAWQHKSHQLFFVRCLHLRSGLTWCSCVTLDRAILKTAALSERTEEGKRENVGGNREGCRKRVIQKDNHLVTTYWPEHVEPVGALQGLPAPPAETCLPDKRTA